MKAVRLNELGGPEKLHVEEIADPVAGPGQIVVKISRAALNRRDVFITQGLYPGIELPKTLGSDGTGVVAALGAGVTGPAIGTAVVIDPEIGWSDSLGHAHKGASVLGMPLDGTFAEYVVVPASNVHKKPAALSEDEAAAIPLAGETAYRAVFTRGQIRKDDVVLITGIGGGVQTFALLYAVHAGARTIVTSGSDEKLARAKALGAGVGINYKTNPDWHKEARNAAGGGGPSLIIDSTGGETFSRCLDIARHEARVVVYGGTAGDAKIRPFSIFWKHLTILGTSMGSPSDFAGMLTLFEGGLRPVVDKVFPLNEAAAAAQRLASSEQFGKVVLAVS
jgi:zinc-binding alcohol dehydrogenase/oxidoreductase